MGLRPCFGRGDEDYLKVESSVMDKLKKISGHDYLVGLQGSASLALEIITSNFLFGNIIIISTGYYSNRLIEFANNAKDIFGEIKNIKIIDYENLDTISGDFDWIVSCYTKQAEVLKFQLKILKELINLKVK